MVVFGEGQRLLHPRRSLMTGTPLSAHVCVRIPCIFIYTLRAAHNRSGRLGEECGSVVRDFVFRLRRAGRFWPRDRDPKVALTAAGGRLKVSVQSSLWRERRMRLDFVYGSVPLRSGNHLCSARTFAALWGEPADVGRTARQGTCAGGLWGRLQKIGAGADRGQRPHI